MPLFSFRRLATLIIATAAFGAAQAGTVEYVKLTSPEDLKAAQEQVMSTFKYQLRGAQRYAANHGPLRTTSAPYETFRREMASATIARMEYTFKNAQGQPLTTIYHGLSGRVPAATLPRQIKATLPGTDMPDWANYFTDINPNVFARIPDGERSVLDQALQHEPSDAWGRRYDAEIRSIRTVERDILARNVPRGGVIRAWVSAPPCDACRATLQQFAETYDINIKVFHWPPVDEFNAPEFRHLQMSKNRITRNFHERVENDRKGTIPKRCPR